MSSPSPGCPLPFHVNTPDAVLDPSRLLALTISLLLLHISQPIRLGLQLARGLLTALLFLAGGEGKIIIVYLK
jgi:hypothetical protein